jgi:F0F1-type ATP synthase epsilon subunit
MLWPEHNAWPRKALWVADLLRLVVWTPSEIVLDVEQVQWVHVNLVGARALTIWPRHASLLAEMASDALQYADAAGTHTVDLPSGVLQVQGSVVTLFLAGILGEQAWSEGEGKFERLAESMLAARASLSPGKPG